MQRLPSIRRLMLTQAILHSFFNCNVTGQRLLASMKFNWRMEIFDVNSDLEEIKQLKARYCRLLDTKQWSEWRSLFTNGFISDTSEAGGKRIESGDVFVGFVQTMLAGRPTVHQVHAPEIVLVSDTVAKGVWALEDFVRLAPGFDMRGSGHYHEVYEKIEGRWHIKESKLTRLREDIMTPFFSIYISPALRNMFATLLRRYKRHVKP